MKDKLLADILWNLYWRSYNDGGKDEGLEDMISALERDLKGQAAQTPDLSVICPMCRRKIGEFDTGLGQGESIDFECKDCGLVVSLEWRRLE